MSNQQEEVPKKKIRYTKCVECDIPLRKLSGQEKTVNTDLEAGNWSRILNKVIAVGDVLCNKCRMLKYRKGKCVAEKKEEIAGPSSDCQTKKTSRHVVPSQPQPPPQPEPLSQPERLSQPEPLSQPELSSPERISQSTLASTTTPSDSSREDMTFVVQLTRPDNRPPIECVEMPFPRVISSHRYCFVCASTKNIINVPNQARKQVFIKRRLYVPKGNRCCPSHVIKNRLFEEDVRNLRIYSNTSTIDVDELRDYFEFLSINSESTIKDKIGDFTLSEERLKVFTGFTWENLIELRQMMTSMKKSQCRDVTQALVVFLFKLRTGNSNATIAAILGIEREQQVSDFCASVMNSFEKDVLPLHFGFAALSRNELIEKETSGVAKRLYNIHNQLALIFDGTYVRHEKSSNNEYQRKSYSGQKKAPLCKPFTICTTNGYIVEMLGPFYANKNDAQIMKIALEQPNGLGNLLREGDICIVDRGFRDVKDHLEDRGYTVLMPALKGKRSQLTTAESNDSRKVTKVRWVVEAVHGIIGQKYRLLHHKMDNKLLPKVGLYCRIACFLNNTFGKRLNSDLVLCDEILAQMQSRQGIENTLASEAETGRWSRRKVPFQRVTSTDLLDFPEITENGLKILFTGSYQLTQAISYLAEMIDEDNNIGLHYLKEKSNILKIEVRSRHINSKTYKCYIDYVPHSTGHSGIKRYYCECANGSRTVGCCSHIAATIYYLSNARYLAKIIRPAEVLSRIFDTEQINPVINDDSDED